MKPLIAYFTAEMGRTAEVAQQLAAVTGGDLFEIKPVKPYTAADLNYMNPIPQGQINAMQMSEEEKKAYQTPGYWLE